MERILILIEEAKRKSFAECEMEKKENATAIRVL